MPAKAENVVVGPGAKKVFEQFFCELFVEPSDEVLFFSPQFPTFGPTFTGAAACRCACRSNRQTRFGPIPMPLSISSRRRNAQGDLPQLAAQSDRRRRHGEDLVAIANLIRGRDVAIFSDEPYCHMVWKRSTLHARRAGMLDQVVRPIRSASRTA